MKKTNEKLSDQYSVAIEVSTGVWHKAGTFKTLGEAKVKALEVCDEFNSRIVRHERTMIETYLSKGKKVKSFSVAFTPNGVKTVKHYA